MPVPASPEMTLGEAKTALAEAGLNSYTVDAGPGGKPADDWIVTRADPRRAVKSLNTVPSDYRPLGVVPGGVEGSCRSSEE